MALYCRGAGRTEIVVAVNRPTRWVNSLIVTDNLLSGDWHCWTIWSFSSWVRPRVIFTESISIPRNCITWHGWRTDFIFIKNPKPCKRNVKVSLASVIFSTDEAMIKISSRNIIRRTFSFLNREMGIFSSFINYLTNFCNSGLGGAEK